jgi:hypothetical protein
MRIQIVKWVSMIGLLSAVLFWNSVATFQFALNLFLCMAAVVVTLRAFQAKESAWVSAFGLIALLFGAFAVGALGNPEQPAIWLSGWFGIILLVVASAAAFTMSLTSLKPVQLRSMPSITDRNPGSLAL